MRTLNLFLLIAALLMLIAWIVPEPADCWLPPNAPTRGIYAECWTPWQLWV